MRYFFFLLLVVSQFAHAQLINSVDLSEKFETTNEGEAKKELLHLASLKTIEKYAPDMGFKYDEFREKLNQKFEASFSAFKERKLDEKFGAGKAALTDAEKSAFLASLEKEKPHAFIRFSHSQEVLKSHSFSAVTQEAGVWKAKVNVDLDKVKVQKLLQRTISNETKPFSKVYLISEIDTFQFTWSDLGLENARAFTHPLDESWLKWLNENIPSTVDEVVICDAACLNFYSKWTETHLDALSIPEEFHRSVFLKVNLYLKRASVLESVKESTFEWEGRSLIQDVGTKRVIGSFALQQESRSLRQLDQKAMNSALASSLYRSPISAFMHFNHRLEEKIGFNRVSKLVIRGHKHLGDVLALNELLKTRGASLGLEVFLESFSKDEAKLVCYYKGEEKSFTDLLSAIKELKSSHSYTLVNEFTGVHHVLKLVTE